MGFMNTKQFNLNMLLWGFIALLMFSFSQVAEAKRFGGGGSFGYQKKIAPKQPATAPKKTTPDSAKTAPTSQTKPASGASKWLGPLAGIAAGGLLAAMLFGDGFEGIQLFDILLFALIAFVLFKIFASVARRNMAYQPANEHSTYRQPQNEYSQPHENNAQRQAHESNQSSNHAAYDANQQGSIIGSNLEDGLGQGASEQAHYFDEIPAWFNAEQFVEGAKGHFMSLQKAWDNLEINEIESYCTPELFSALQQQMAEMQSGQNHTRVDELDAEIATMAIDGDYLVVSLRFTGFIEEDDSGAHAFNEIWHIRRLANDEGDWRIAGIQQVNA